MDLEKAARNVWVGDYRTIITHHARNRNAISNPPPLQPSGFRATHSAFSCGVRVGGMSMEWQGNDRQQEAVCRHKYTAVTTPPQSSSPSLYCGRVYALPRLAVVSLSWNLSPMDSQAKKNFRSVGRVVVGFHIR